MRVLSIILTMITLCFGFTTSAWAASELVTPHLLRGSGTTQCVVTNATATKTLSVNITLVDIFGHTVRDDTAIQIAPRAAFIAVTNSSLPLSCVVDVLGGQDASLVRVVLVVTDTNDDVISLVQAR